MTSSIVIAAIALTYIAWREWRHEKERQELYSRLMARDLAEFAVFSKNDQPPSKSRSFIRLPQEGGED